MRIATGLVLLGWILGCSGLGGKGKDKDGAADADTDTDTDTDADGDADADTDTDGDTDTDPVPEVECDTTIPICSGAECRYDAAIVTATVTGAVTLDGGALLADSDWQIVWVETSSGAEYTSEDFTRSYSVLVPPGSFDVHLVRDGTLPQDEVWPVASDVTIASDASHDFDVESVVASGTLAVDGTPLPDVDGTHDWGLIFTDSRSGLAYGEWSDGPTYTAYLPPGTYDVTALGDDDDGVLHKGEVWPVATGVAVTRDAETDYDIDTVTLTGRVSVNGEPLADVEGSDDWRVILVDPATGAFHGGEWEDGPDYAIRVPPGTWDVTVDGSDEALAVGTQLWYVELGADVRRDTERDYDIDAVTVHGEVTFGGETMDDGGGNPDWQMVFTDPVTGVSYAGDEEGGTAYTVLLPVGTWDVYAAGRFDAHVLGLSDWPLDTGVSVTRDTTLDYDIEVVRVSGRLRVNGAPPEEGSTWSALLVDTSTGERYRGDYVSGADYEVPAPPGSYDVWVDGTTDNTVIGLSEWRAEAGMTFARDTDLDLDLEAFEVTGELTVDGTAMPDVAGDEDWRVSFSDAETGENYRHDADGPTYSVWVPAGDYSVQVRGESEDVPLSDDWWIAECVDVG